MKKKIFSIALAAIALVSFSASAQCPAQSESSCKDGKECIAHAKKMKDGKGEGKGKKLNFDGIALTEAQQTKLNELEAKQQAQRQARQAEMKEKKAAEKAEKQQRDQKDKEARMAQKKAAKQEYLKQIQAILTPQQYVQFLENNVKLGHEGKPGMHKGMKEGRGQKGDKMDKQRKGDREQGQQAFKFQRKGDKQQGRQAFKQDRQEKGRAPRV